jgi:hypothetical protein
VSDWDAYQAYRHPVLSELFKQGLVFLGFFLEFGAEVEVRAEADFDEE